MPLPDPVIVVPGVTASYLRDTYPIPSEIIWQVLDSSKLFARAAMHPNNIRLEAQEPARVVSDQLYEVAYKELIEELRHNLTSNEDAPVPVYPFSYDWRQPLADIQKLFEAFIVEVIERTSLMRHYYLDGYDARRTVSVVGHSMGGLIIAGYLAEKSKNHSGEKTAIGKIVTLATPFQGSIEAVVKTVSGDANLGASSPSSREREAARMTPSLYHLMPSFNAGVTIPASLPQTLFDPSVWQRSIKNTLIEYARLRGRNPEDAANVGLQAFGELLDLARAHRDSIDSLDLGKIKLSSSDWLCVVGADTDTRVRLEIVADGPTGPEFRFHGASDIQNDWPNSRLTGDGTVPFEGAIPPFLPYESLVCVTPDDFGFAEVQDKLLAKAAGFHGILPNMNMLHRLIVQFLKPGARGDVGGGPPPGIARQDWRPPPPFTAKTQ